MRNLSSQIGENINVILLLVSLCIVQVANWYFPEYSQITGIVTIVMLFAIIFMWQYLVRDVARSFPHLEIMLYGAEHKQKLNCFIEGNLDSHQVSKTSNPSVIYETPLKLHWDVQHDILGKISKIVIQHEFDEFKKRANFKQERIEFREVNFEHPASDSIVCYETGIINMEGTNPIPTLFLVHGGNDYNVARDKAEGQTNCNKCKQYEIQVSDMTRQIHELAQKKIELEQIVEALKDIISGLQRFGTRIQEKVWMLFNEWRMRQQGIANALKSRGLHLSFNTTVLLLIVGLGIVGVILWAKPEILEGVGYFFNQPYGYPVLGIGIALGIVLLYFYIRRRG